MMPSVEYLQSAGLITDPASVGHPLTQIRIIDATPRLIRAPETLFDSSEAGLAAFGWNFANAKLLESFETARAGLPNLETREAAVTGVERAAGGWRVTFDGGSVTTPFLVGCDGKKSFVRSAGGFRTRENAFAEAALVCDLELGRPIGGTSVEFHYPRGPFTLVPAGGEPRQPGLDRRPRHPEGCPVPRAGGAARRTCWRNPSTSSATSRR